MVTIKISNSSSVPFSDHAFEIYLDTSAITRVGKPMQALIDDEIIASQWILATNNQSQV